MTGLQIGQRVSWKEKYRTSDRRWSDDPWCEANHEALIVNIDGTIAVVQHTVDTKIRPGLETIEVSTLLSKVGIK